MDPFPQVDQVPTYDGGAQTYKAAGKLKGRKALITGGDSGIGRATAVLFAMEGAEVMITYLEAEQEDADFTKKMVEERGGKIHLHVADLRTADACKKTVDKALENMGAINILFNNHAFQMMQDTILDIPEEQWLKTFDTNIHGKISLWQPLPQPRAKLTFSPLSFLLPVKIHPPTHDQRRHYYQRRQRQRLHRPSRLARLHEHKGRHHRFHIRP